MTIVRKYTFRNYSGKTLFRGGVYAYRTNKPGAFFGWPIIGRHWGYVGESLSLWHRNRQHLLGGGKYDTTQQPWSDLKPKRYHIPLPGWKPLLLLVEALAIALLWPVYNDKRNRWNPRRISRKMARAQRRARESGSITLRVLSSLRPASLTTLLVVAVTMASVWGMMR